MAAAYASFTAALASDLLDAVPAQPPAFFERLLLDVVQAMGYGGGPGAVAEHLGKSGDEGFDGVIYEDQLGLDLIYLQAKRWTNTVGRPDIQTFVGALQGKSAHRGVFITTSSFSKEARDYARNVPTRLALIDGPRLAQLMIEHGVGVSDVQTFVLRHVDTDYFEDS